MINRPAPNSNIVRRVFAGLLWVVIITFSIVLFTQPRMVVYGLRDFYYVPTYEPSSYESEMLDRISLTETGERIYRASHTRVVDKASFGDSCPTSEAANVLGCYNSDFIYVLRVEDEQLSGVEEVTAIHEVLHGAWARLSDSKRDQLTDQLLAVYNSQNDERLTALIENYRRTAAPGQADKVVANELHSILATEVEELPDELESYYAGFISDRAAIYDYFEQYESEFSDRRERIAQIQAELSDLNVSISTQNQAIDALAAQNDQLVAQIQQLRNQGEIAASNNLVRQQNQLVVQIRDQIDALNQSVAQYNQLVIENNDLAVELNDLASSLSSREVSL